MKELLDLVNEQAEDDALWCLEPTITEHMLQRALRKLHAAIEALAVTSTHRGSDNG